MKKMRNMTIRQKLTAIMMLLGSVIVLFVVFAGVVTGQMSSRKKLIESLNGYADIVAENSKAAIAFEDKGDAEKMLSALKATETIMSACIYNADGNVFAIYQRQDVSQKVVPDSPTDQKESIQDGKMFVFKKIHDGEFIGTICLVDDMGQLREALIWNYTSGLIVLVFAMIITYFLSKGLQKVISKPIFNFAETVKKIAEEKDYSARAIKESDDEIGQLIDSFNEMLAQIQNRDKALTNAKEQLEERVEKRTAELSVANEHLKEEAIEREKAEVTLKENEEKFRMLFDTANDAIMILQDGKFIDCNDKTLKMFGLDKEVFITKTPIDVSPEIQQDGEKSADKGKRLIGLALSGKPQSFEWIHCRATGEIFEADVALVRFELKGKTCLQAVVRDITERKEAERAIIAAKEQAENSRNELEMVNGQLAVTYKKLVEASRQAGMAEVATDVLHNVGNVLNSINVSVTLIDETIQNSDIANLGKLAELVEANEKDAAEFFTNDPAGKHVLPYLVEVSKHLTKERTEIIDKLKSLTNNVEHIKEIVKMQQTYAKASGVEILITIDEIMDDAIQINEAGLKRHGITLKKELDDIGIVSVDKQKILQILVNLINNAKYALTNSKKDDKLLTIKSSTNEKMIKVEIIDNGIGIADDNLKKIFRHGFTTKTNGHGFGLHSGALAAKEMGGSLAVHSDGLGLGAKLVLEVPLKRQGAVIQ